jgi:outer membrane receptor protein involved in Fe transport
MEQSNMGNDRKLQLAIRAVLATVAATGTAPLAMAQTVAANNTTTTTDASALQEVVVTGSRIAVAPNDISISPITTVTAVDIAQTGLIRPEDILNSLPQVTAEQGSGESISSNGTSTVSLRDLGSQRTLVLVNGVRMNPGGAGGVGGVTGNANAADISQIPTPLIERIDVLTGGASSVYGADAVAGVVNFVLNTHYEGVKVDADYGFNNHHNNNTTDLADLASFGAEIPPNTVNTGQNKQFSIVAGSNFADGKGNATAYFSYLNSSPAVGYQFDHAGCTLEGGATPGSAITCGGSGTSPNAHVYELGLIGGHATTIIDSAVDPKTGVLRPFQTTDLYNYGALSYFQRPAEKYTAGAFLHYDINDYASVYLQTMFARNTSTGQYGPDGAFYSLETISCTDPLLTAQEKSVVCNPTALKQNQEYAPNTPANSFTTYIARRNTEGGGRQDNYTSDSLFQTIGVKGAFADAWTYDAYAKLGITQFSDIEGNFIGQPQINNALNVVPNPAVGGVAGVAVGAPVCESVVNGSDPKCVPWNIWTPGGVTAAQLAYLTVPSTWSTTALEYIADASVTGDLGKYGVKLPWANDGMSLNVGAEYREEKFDFSPDYIYANGLVGGGSPSYPINGEFHVFEGFTEFKLPILNEMPYAYNLSADAGYRYSSYTEGFDTNTFKFGVEWAPIKDVRLRGGFNRAVRAPNIDELYAPATVTAGGTADPCWGTAPALTLTQCERTGVSAGEYGHIGVNPAAQINTQLGGNSGLTPELADTYTYGIVFQPTFVPNLVASLDFFRIVIKNTITSLSSNTIIDDCATTGNAALCALIHRGPTGSLWLAPANYVTATELNIGSVSTKGLDFAAHYRYDAGLVGKFSFNLSDTYTTNFETQPITGGSSYNCAGYWGATCGAPLPHIRQVFTVNWQTPVPGLDYTLKWRLIGPSKVDSESQNPELAGAYYLSTAQIPGYNYIDMSANYSINSLVDVRVGVNNITDKDPPLVLNGNLSNCPNTTCNDNTWTGTYDTLGRYLYAHVSMKF